MSPPVYRRAISREDNNDVFARLGAGQSDPTPGGTIRELAGKVRYKYYTKILSYLFIPLFEHHYSLQSNPNIY